MDSGNSGSLSLQSSSGGGGDDEFDSRCGGGGVDSSPLAALLRHPPSPVPPSSCSVPPVGFGAFYDLHQDLATPPEIFHFGWSSPTTTTTQLAAGGGASAAPPQSSSSSHHGAPAPVPSADQLVAGPPGAQPQPARASRKRTRASRRAPTTVLTTDTSNFRAMVQEFTGVPAPPFAASARSSSRLDHHLFIPSRSSAGLSSPYLLRPFAQKLHHQAQAPPSYQQPPAAFVAAPASTPSSSPAPTSNAVAASTATASSDSYQIVSAPPSSVIAMQDHSGGNYVSFQTLIGGAQLDGSATRYPASHPVFDPSGFWGLAHGVVVSDSERTQLPHRRHRDRDPGSGDELSGLVRAASGSSASGNKAKATYTDAAGGPAASSSAGPLVEISNAHSTSTTTTVSGAAAVATTTTAPPPVVESWICSTSE